MASHTTLPSTANNATIPGRAVSKPAPTGQQVEEAQDYASQLFHAHQARPTLDSPLRSKWDLHFTKTCNELACVLNSAKFKNLPPFVIGCMWEYNQYFFNGGTHMNAEAITPAYDTAHPGLNPTSSRRIHYWPVQEGGDIAILPRSLLRSTWWEAYGAFK